jgi:hypothetical protein
MKANGAVAFRAPSVAASRLEFVHMVAARASDSGFDPKQCGIIMA